jgi:nitroreductase
MIHPPPRKPSTTNYYKSTSALNPWSVEEDDFPADGKTSEQLEFLLNYAFLDPSIHNTQPWVFKIIDDAIELYLDKASVLATADPNYRESIVGCGAALFNLRIAIRYFGYRDIVEVFPEPYSPNLLARISFGSKRIVQLEETFLFRAISKRSTNRFYANRNLPTHIRQPHR